MPIDPQRFHAAIARFDAANAEDPHTEVCEGITYPKELLYAQRLTTWLERLAPDASEALRLAARCQHIRRWLIPRQRFPMNRHGYLRWRTTLGKFHAETAGDILREVGYEDALIHRVQSLLRKEDLKRDAEMQCLEDAICLVFLEHSFADFTRQHEAAKVTDIVRKTWKKMSPRGRDVACTLSLSDEAQRLLEVALMEQP